MNKGIIVSIQGYNTIATETLAREAVNACAVAIRTDKPIEVDVPIIGLQKVKVGNTGKEAYITPTIEDVEKVGHWADFVAIDYRMCNKNLNDISDYCKKNKIKVIADIMCFADYENIKENGYQFDYIATTLSVLNPGNKRYYPDIRLVKSLIAAGCRNLIAEGNYNYRKDVKEVLDSGVHAVCIGTAISDVYKLTRRYTSILL